MTKHFLYALFGLSLLAAACGSSAPAKTNATKPSATNVAAAAPTGNTLAFNITAKNFAFSPSTIKVKTGDRVEIKFSNAEGTHDWVVDEFDARSKMLRTGQSDTVTFMADKSGSFEFYCSVGKHRAMGMTGKLVVE